MFTELDAERSPAAQPVLASDGIEVRRALGAEPPVVAAARAWARAFESARRQEPTASEGAELALYNALARVDMLKDAELALYEAVIASEFAPR